jgi:hypothetical protein
MPEMKELKKRKLKAAGRQLGTSGGYGTEPYPPVFLSKKRHLKHRTTEQLRKI